MCFLYFVLCFLNLLVLGTDSLTTEIKRRYRAVRQVRGDKERGDRKCEQLASDHVAACEL